VIFSPHFIADGQSIVTLLPGDRERLSILDTVTGQVQLELGTHSKAIGVSSTSVLGQVYSWGLDGKLKAWDLQNGAVKWEFNAAGSPSWF
jgi:outer membrane protein assembly factor BamB